MHIVRVHRPSWIPSHQDQAAKQHGGAALGLQGALMGHGVLACQDSSDQLLPHPRTELVPTSSHLLCVVGTSQQLLQPRRGGLPAL